MITVVLTYRNREINIVKNCLDSLQSQSNNNFKVVLVDYGSDLLYNEKLFDLIKKYSFVHLIKCKTEQELWCKSRAVNIVLKQCETPYMFVGDVDMIYHPSFVDRLHDLKKDKQTTYFQVGFLSESESKTNKIFSDYEIQFKSTKEATGMTLYNTQVLKAINGYDEFYHGWGSEDTDVHVRLKNTGNVVRFYNETVLVLHQWHPKTYRTSKSLAPFHSYLERLNSEYLKFVESTGKTKANLNFNWGTYNVSNYTELNTASVTYNITNKETEFKAFVNNVLLQEKHKVVKVTISLHDQYRSGKLKLKKLLGQKTISFLDMQRVNDDLLEFINMNLRNSAYKFCFDSEKQTIQLTIKL